MKKLISVFAALMFSAAIVPMAQAASADKGYYYGARDPEHLAQLIADAHAKDPSGTTLISATKCKKDGSCATPRDYFEAINLALERAGFKKRLKEVSEVPAYMRTLKVLHSPHGKYEVSCLRPVGDNKFKPVMDCVEREFETDEEGWVDSEMQGDYNVDLVIITSKCANVIYKKVAMKITIVGGTPACVEIHFTTKPGDVVPRFALTAPAGYTISDDDGCLAVKRAGSTVYERWWTDYCATVHCDFSAATAFIGTKVIVMGSFEVKEHGTHILRLPAYVAKKDSRHVTILCLDRVKLEWLQELTMEYARKSRDEYIAQRDEYIKQLNAWVNGHSDSVYVWWNAYRIGNDGVPRARIYYTEADVPASETVKMYWRWGVWAREHEARSR